MGADLRLRSLHRAAASGDLESQARELLERVRAGSLTRERLELAAYCGDPVARVAHGDSVFGAAAEAGIVDLEAWVRGLARWGNPVLVRGALAAAEAARNHEFPVSIDEQAEKWSHPDLSESTRAAAREGLEQSRAGTQTIRKAIREALVRWALEDRP